MNLTNFTENIANGMNNPDCAFFVGATAGQWSSFEYVFEYVMLIMIFVILFRLVGNVTQLTWDLTLRRIKILIQKKRKNRGGEGK